MTDNIFKHLSIPVEDIIAASNIRNKAKLCRIKTVDVGIQTEKVVIIHVNNDNEDDDNFDVTCNANIGRKQQCS